MSSHARFLDLDLDLELDLDLDLDLDLVGERGTEMGWEV
jgi:hypothetical protein